MSKGTTKKGLRFSKVLWISDRSYPDYNGGAERTDYVIRDAGKKLGLEIDWISTFPKDTEKYDLVVISNIHMWKDEVAEQLLLETYTPILFFSHDPLIHRWYPTAIKQAFCSVFMSPAHCKFYRKKFFIKNYIVQPHGIIDLDRWYGEEKREDYCLYVGDLNTYKGAQNVYKWAEENPDREVRVWGRHMVKFPFTIDNFKYYGWMDEEELPKKLATASYFIHLPEYIDPCPRMIMFALLSGCEIIGNDNIGTSSYDWPWENLDRIKDILRKAPEEFWRKVNKYYRKEEG